MSDMAVKVWREGDLDIEQDNLNDDDLMFRQFETTEDLSKVKTMADQDSRQRISGCIFGFVGFIMLAFSLFLI